MEPVSGVSFTAPPPHLIADVQDSIREAVAQLPPGAKGAIVGVTTEQGVNAAVVTRFAHVWIVQAWIGKAWGAPLAGGAAVTRSW